MTRKRGGFFNDELTERGGAVGAADIKKQGAFDERALPVETMAVDRAQYVTVTVIVSV
jgi:hypothetical protein